MKVLINVSGRLFGDEAARVFAGEEVELPDHQGRELISRGEAVEVVVDEAKSPEADAKADAGDEAWKATGAAEKLASELGVELAAVQGSGKDGLITKADVASAAREGR